MTKHLHLSKRFLSLFLTLLLGLSGTSNLFAQISEGAITGGMFTINANGDKVMFSKGNLQYIGSASTPYWKFADNQWDYLGTSTNQNYSNYNYDRDLFGWGTSGYNHGAVRYQPWEKGQTNSDYYAYGNSSYNLYDQTGQADWGYNAISNGGNTENIGWRTLTKDEWNYVFNTRSASTVNGTANARYVKAQVELKKGIILFPDSYTHPTSVTQPTNINKNVSSFNNYSVNDFALMQSAGAVFLPAAGSGSGTTISNINSEGYYWSASYYDSNRAYYTDFATNTVSSSLKGDRYRGMSVRLVAPVENFTFNISTTSNPTTGGTVSVGGTYQGGTECSITATPSAGYVFENWVENGTVVSTNATYSFVVVGNRSLVANFVQEGNIAFTDANVKALCVTNWDTNGDGELSYMEAASVTTLGDVFKGNTTIQSFRELQYFYALGVIGNEAFYGCTALTLVTIPVNVTSVGNRAFWNCPALQTLYFNATNCTSMSSTYSTNTTYDQSVFSSNEYGAASSLKSVVIANGVTCIPNYAFKNCSQIYPGITIRSSVKTIGSNAFENCSSMTTLSFQSNSSLTTIGAYAFSDCSALNKALNLPNSVNTIGGYAFLNCVAIPSLTIGENVTTIGNFAFGNCTNLATVYFNATNCTQMLSYSLNTSSYYSVFAAGDDGATPIVSLTIGNNVTRIPDYAFYNSTNMTSSITIPDATISIGQYAFGNCSLIPSMVIGNGVTTIGKYSCYGCSSLSLLTIGDSVTTIGDYSFWYCPNLAMVNFNATNCTRMYTQTGSGTSSSPYVYYSVFNDGNNKTPNFTLYIGENVTRIPDYAFRNYNGSDMTGNLILPNGLTYIGQYAFYRCNGFTGDLIIPNTVSSIGQFAFYNCSGLNGILALPVNNIYSIIRSSTFYGCSHLTGTLTIPATITQIDEYAFYNCYSFTGSLILHNAITNIGQYAFNGSKISELTIGEGITSIGDKAFWRCPNLATVHFNAINCTSMVSNSQYSVFSITSESSVTPIVTLTIGENVTRIPDKAFRNSTNLTSVITIPNATTYIGEYAFNGARSTELTIGEGVTSIGNNAFWNCPDLATVHFNATNCTSMVSNSQYSVFSRGSDNTISTPIVTLTIGDNVTNIPNYAFRNSSNMTGDLIIPNSVISMGKYAFANSSGHNVFTGKNLTSIPNYTFAGSTFNGTLLFGDALVSIGERAFSDCNSFTGDLVIPNAVTSMGQYAFNGCSGFNGSLILGNGIQTINQNTFAGCSGFSGALIFGTQVNSIWNNAFQNCSAFSLLITENANPITATSSSFTGMTYSIPVYVPDGLIGNYQSATGWNNFTNYIEQYTFWQELDTDNWSDELNWLSMELPGENDVVCIAYNCDVDIDVDVLHVYVYNINDVLTVKSGKILNTAYGIGVVQPSQLVMEDGSQLYNTIPGVCGTLKKTITGYGTGDDGWFTIATPIYDGVSFYSLATGSYDLYYYDEPAHYWRNQKNSTNDFTTLNLGQGYLYANMQNKDLSLAGQLNASNAEVSVPVTCEGGVLAGFNLVGNPYTNNISITDVKVNGTAQTAFYRAEGGNNLVAYVAEDNEPIKPGQGFFVKATENGTLTFGSTPTRGESQPNGNYVRLTLSKDGQVADRAFLCMSDGQTLEKVSLSNAHSQLYFKNGNGRYAVAANEAVNGVMPLCLEKAKGTYTIDASLLNVECGYLHLIDDLTGADIDLLETPSYTFEAKPGDEASRFKLVFEAQ